MAYYAWYYNAGQGTYYWGESFKMSCTQFAQEVSSLTGKKLGPGDISAATKNDMDKVERRASNLIHID